MRKSAMIHPAESFAPPVSCLEPLLFVRPDDLLTIECVRTIFYSFSADGEFENKMILKLEFISLKLE